MALHHRSEHLVKEHKELLHVADRIEEMLESASKNDFTEHLKCLRGLPSLQHHLAGIVEHCHMGGDAIESMYRHSLQQDERTRIGAEHEQVIRALTEFREELKFATPDRTMAIILPGMDLVNRLRAHIAYEREMLGRIAEAGSPPARPAGKRKAGERAQRKQRGHASSPKTETKAMGFRPYTLESHPEL